MTEAVYTFQQGKPDPNEGRNSDAPNSLLPKYEPHHTLGYVMEQDGMRYVATDVNCSAGVYGGPDDFYVTEFVREDSFHHSPAKVNAWAGCDTGALRLLPRAGSTLLMTITGLVNEFLPQNLYAAQKLASSFSDAVRYFAAHLCYQEGVRPEKVMETLRRHGKQGLSERLSRVNRKVSDEILRHGANYHKFLSSACLVQSERPAVDSAAPQSLLERSEPHHQEGYVIEKHAARYIATEHVNVEADMYGGPEGSYVTEFVRDDLATYPQHQVAGWMGEVSLFRTETQRMVASAHFLVGLHFPQDAEAAEKAASSFADIIRYFAAFLCDREGIQMNYPLGATHEPGFGARTTPLARVGSLIEGEISRQVQHWSLFLADARSPVQRGMDS